MDDKEMNNEASPKPAPDGENAVNQAEAPAIELPADLPAAYQKVVADKLDLYDRLLRKQAELDNFRKRVQREKEEFFQHANADLILSFLPVLDGFERALRHHGPKTDAGFTKGIELIHQQMLSVLDRAGVTPIETAGKTFDPHLHQAVETVQSNEHRDQEVVEELQRGYKLKNRLLRPAIVKVASAPKKG
ncbi:MAG TPA: nucleotide exchange factor GrpE [Terriglobia bacterium]|nr:nucleotide exchange factor GrpE [Terriglobia bacterium]